MDKWLSRGPLKPKLPVQFRLGVLWHSSIGGILDCGSIGCEFKSR